MARPSALTPEVQELICEAIRAGNYREVAAVWAGVSVRTVQHWCTLGRRVPDGPHGVFLRAVLQAEKDAEMEMVGVVFTAAKADPDHAWKWLERKYGQRWGTQNREIRELKRRVEEMEKAQGGVPRPSEPASRPLASAKR